MLADTFCAESYVSVIPVHAAHEGSQENAKRDAKSMVDGNFRFPIY